MVYLSQYICISVKGSGSLRDVFTPVSALIDEKLKEEVSIIAAIDGRCASGKTTLANRLSEHYGCSVIHMDHFFLKPEQRTAKRLETPGGNVDYERVLREVITPLKEKKDVSYCPYDCQSGRLQAPIRVKNSKIVIIEGAYSCHPALFDSYDLKIFLTVDKSEQLKRLMEREPATKIEAFKTKWIPLEEKYFSACEVEEKCDGVFSTSENFYL